jgi:putative methyltransferase (TIGR04325 family)
MGNNKFRLLRWLPPALLDLYRLFSFKAIRLSGYYDNWDDAMAQCKGYNQSIIFEKTLASALEVKNGNKPFERDSVLFDRIVYSWPILASLNWAAAEASGKLRVLDFGGALGTSYFQNKKFIDHLSEVCWHIVEQPNLAELGNKHLKNESLSFSSNIEDAFRFFHPNFVLLSSVLQYVKDPFEVIANLASRDVPVIALDRTPFLNEDKKTFIQKQSVPSQIYSASYPCYLFNENEITTAFRIYGYQLVESFHSFDKLSTKATWKGMIFKKTS